MSARALELVAFLSAQERLKEAFVVLDQANALGTARGEILLARAGLELKAGQLKQAEASVDAAMKLGVQDAGLSVLRARLLIASQGANGADAALQILDQAAVRTPSNLNVQRERIELVVTHKKWNAAARSLEGLKLALFHNYGSRLTRISGQGALRLSSATGTGRSRSIGSHWRIVRADVSLWLEYARAAETGGRDTTAREAYGAGIASQPKQSGHRERATSARCAHGAPARPRSRRAARWMVLRSKASFLL